MPRKMKLNLDELAVESFATGDAPDLKGTVRGNIGTSLCTQYAACTQGATCTEPTCGTEPTCNYAVHSCAPSCGACDTYYCGGDGDTLICNPDGSGITRCETCLVDCD